METMDDAARMEGEFDTEVLRWLIAVVLILIGICIGYVWRMVQDEAAEKTKARVQRELAVRQARLEYPRKLRYHGLNGKISVIEVDWDSREYFWRDGQRVAFR